MRVEQFTGVAAICTLIFLSVIPELYLLGEYGQSVTRLSLIVPITFSYQTPNGKVTGIQWVPAEATQMLPSGAQPATAVGNVTSFLGLC